MSTSPDRKVSILTPSLSGNVVFTTAALGLVASFLSSFNSALLASVHLQLILIRTRQPTDSEEARFHWLMVAVYGAVCLMFAAGLATLHNPWLLGNFLMGAYAAIAGVQIGTRGRVSLIPENYLEWVFILGILGWFLYFISSPGFSSIPTIYSVNTVPAGVCVFLATAVFSKFLTYWRPKE